MRKTLIALMLAIAIGLGVALSGSSAPSASADGDVRIRFICQFDSGFIFRHDLVPGHPDTASMINDLIQICNDDETGGTLLPPEVIRTAEE